MTQRTLPTGTHDSASAMIDEGSLEGLTAIVERPEDEGRNNEQRSAHHRHRNERRCDSDSIEDAPPEIVRQTTINT